MSEVDSHNPPPSTLVGEALEIIQSRSLKRRDVDWETVRPATLGAAQACSTLEAAHKVIRDLLKRLGDNHSFLWTPVGRKKSENPDHAGFRLHQEEPVIIDVFANSPAAAHGLRPGDRVLAVDRQEVTGANWRSLFLPAQQAETALEVHRAASGKEETLTLGGGFIRPNPLPGSFMTPEGFGVIDLPGHLGEGGLPGGQNYAERVQRALHEQERAGAKGWVIDLRRNDGGNMWPMLAGLTPLLGVGRYGSFFDPVDDVRWLWRFDGDAVMCTREDQPNERYEETDTQGYAPLANTDAPVAVLSSRVTSSSGEAVMLAFLGRPRTQTFGLPTGGLATCNGLHKLADDSWLLLTSSVMADRLGRAYLEGVTPEHRVEIDWRTLGTPDDPVMARAVSWLNAI